LADKRKTGGTEMKHGILTIVFSALAIAACGVDTEDDMTGLTGTGGSVTSTGGTTQQGTGGSVTSTGGVVSTGGSSAFVCDAAHVGQSCPGLAGYTCQLIGSSYVCQATGGTGGTSSSITYPPKPTTQCPSMFNVGPTSIVMGGYSFTQDWVVKPSADGKAIIVNPVWPFANNVGTCMQYSGTVKLKPYDLSNDSGVVVDPTPAKHQLDGRVCGLTSEGLRCEVAGVASGNIHFNVVLNDAWWMIINGAAWSDNLPAAARLYVEKTQAPIKDGAGSLGMVVRWDGNTVSVASPWGGNYR
jgi:hypothetical protein